MADSEELKLHEAGFMFALVGVTLGILVGWTSVGPCQSRLRFKYQELEDACPPLSDLYSARFGLGVLIGISGAGRFSSGNDLSAHCFVPCLSHVRRFGPDITTS